jgi:2TM domain
MPPRWSRVPTRDDPDYRKLDDRVTFATHVAAFLAVNSGVWFFRMIQKADWPWAIWLSGLWLTVFISHAIYVFAIAKYEDMPTKDPS